MKPVQYDQSKVRSILVEVDLSTAAAAGIGEFTLGSVAQLRDCVGLIKAEVFNTTLQTMGPSAKVNLPDACLKTCFLSIFNSENTEVRARIPVAKLIRSNGNSAIEPLNIFGTETMPRPIDPQRSKLIVGDLSTKGAGTIALIEFIYLVK